jgi:cell division protein FtsW (lipid II flippase)
MLTIILLGLWGVMLAGRALPVGRALHRLLVELPCRRIAAVSRGQMLLAVLMLTLVVGLIWLLEDDGRMLVAMGLPDVMAVAAAIDLSALLDVAAVAVLGAGTTRISAIRTWVGQRVVRARRPRAIRVRRPHRPSNDDEERPGFALAA